MTAFAAVVALVLGTYFPSQTNDTIVRYAPMAEHFAHGSWFQAFHPRFGVLFSVLTGLFVNFFGVDGFSACVAVAMIGWALCIVPLYRLVRSVFDVPTAWMAVAVFVFSPQPLFWGFQGLRETWRMLGIVLAVAGLFEPFESRRVAFVEMLLGTLILLTIRVDTVLFAVLAWSLYAFRDRCGWRFGVLTVWCLLVVQPVCYLNWLWTGWWIPGHDFVAVFTRFWGFR